MVHKYKVGDTVKCITPQVSTSKNGGVGWVDGRVFTVSEERASVDYLGEQVLWGVDSPGGVYSNWVEEYDTMKEVTDNIKLEIGL